MGSIDVGIGHDDNLVVAQFADIHSLAVFFSTNCHAESLEDIGNFFAVEHLVLHRLLDVENLTAQRQNCLELAVATFLSRTACRVTLDEEEFAFFRFARRACGEFTGKTARER